MRSLFDSILGACLGLGGNDDGNIDDDEDETDEEEGDDGADDDEKTSERRERREPKSSLTVGIFYSFIVARIILKCGNTVESFWEWE